VPVGRGKAAAAAGGVMDVMAFAGSGGAGAMMIGNAAGEALAGGGSGTAGGRGAGTGAALVGAIGGGGALRRAVAVAGFGAGRAVVAAEWTGAQPGTGRPARAFIFSPCALTILHRRRLRCYMTADTARTRPPHWASHKANATQQCS
jgi:hypothetical protein